MSINWDTFGNVSTAIGATIASTYAAINAPRVATPPTQTPQASTVQTATNFLSGSMGEILVLVAVGVAVAFGFRAIKRK